MQIYSISKNVRHIFQHNHPQCLVCSVRLFEFSFRSVLATVISTLCFQFLQFSWGFPINYRQWTYFLLLNTRVMVCTDLNQLVCIQWPRKYGDLNTCVKGEICKVYYIGCSLNITLCINVTEGPVWVNSVLFQCVIFILSMLKIFEFNTLNSCLMWIMN